VKVGAGLLRRDNEGSVTPRSDTWFLGASAPFADAYVFDAEFYRYDLKDSSNDANLYAARVLYNFSRRTAVYLTAGYMDNKNSSAIPVAAGATVGIGMNQTGVMTGLRHFF
jgi:predicted porin